MKLTAICLFFYLYVFQTSVVESGVIADRISSGFGEARQGVKCGIQKIGGLFGRNQDSSCDPNATVVESHESTVKASTQITENKSSSTESSAKTTSTERGVVTVPSDGGKRVITVGANCPAGYRGDGQGNCREEY